MSPPTSCVRFLVGMAVLALASGAGAADAVPADEVARAKAALSAAGISAGLCAQVGGDGRLVAGLASASRRLNVEGLVGSVETIPATRARLYAHGLLGRANVQPHAASTLPYAPWSLNLLVLDGDTTVTDAEIKRVLAPGGAAVKNVGGTWQKIATQPRPAQMDTWMHRRHGPDRVPRSADTLVGPPEVPQWIAGPIFQNTPLLATEGLIVAIDSGQQVKRQTIYARDAYNGLERWRHELEFDFARTSLPGNGWGGGDTPANRAMYAFCSDGKRLFAATSPKPVSLDLADGSLKAAYDAGAPANAVAVADGTLVIATDKGLRAYATANDALRWQADMVPLDLTLSGGLALALDTSRFPYDLVACDLASGKERWRTSMRPYIGDVAPSGKLPASAIRLVFALDGRLFLQSRTAEPKLIAISADTGKELWSKSPAHTSPRTKTEQRMIDLHSTVFANGLLWVSVGSNTKLGLDPATGEVRIQGDAHDMNNNCQYSLATDRFASFKGSYWMDVATGKRVEPYVTDLGHAGGCTAQGAILANGLVYLGVKYCPCSNGGYSLRAGYPLDRDDDPLLQQLGKATKHTKLRPVPPSTTQPGAPLPPAAASGTDDWPVLGGSSRRVLASTMAVPASLRQTWRTEIAAGEPSEWTTDIACGNRISPPVIAAGKAVVADSDGNTVVALDAATGKVAWRFHAGGRIDGPPTLADGLAVFGCRDGSLYALRLDDGRVVWQNRLAGSPRRIVSHGQLESLWPAVSSVVLDNGMAFTMTGYNTNFVTRLFAYGVSTKDGAVAWAQMRSPDNWTVHRRTLQAIDNAGMLYQLRDAIPIRTGLGVRQNPADGGAAKTAATGFVQTHFADFPYNRRYPRALRDPDVTACDGTRAYVFGHDADRVMAVEPGSPSDHRRKPLWSLPAPAGSKLSALVVSGGTLLAAGGSDPAKPAATGFLLMIDPATGAKRQQIALPAPVAYHGIAPAAGRVYVSLVDGSLVCLGAQ